MALSTFWQAAKFCDEYDYIFCHNEAFLYEFIEENDPALFKKIQELVKCGKWRIMGGWYLQPDCNAPCGEAFVRQIKLGRDYFYEKFGVKPTVALNFDSFGHSLGLPQILKKCGYDGYLFCRPMDFESYGIDYREFWWVGKDGSRIKAARAEDDTIYCSEFGKAKTDIERKAAHYKDKEVGIALWGVGNHGGQNSAKDLRDVAEMIKNSDCKIFHSYPEKYFDDINPTLEINATIQPWLRGSYSSMSSMKTVNSELEDTLFSTEKIISTAAISGKIERFGDEVILNAEKALARLEFHDVLSGTCCPDGEKSTLYMAQGVIFDLNEAYHKAFFALTKDYVKAQDGEYPVFVFNNQPYEREALCEVEILLQEPLISDTVEYKLSVFQNGVTVPSQRIKEMGNINFDRRIRIVFSGKLNALNVTRFDIKVKIASKNVLTETNGDVILTDSVKKVKINGKTGLLDSFMVGGKELLSGGAFEPIMFTTTEDSWGRNVISFNKEPKPIKLSNCNRGIFKGYKNVRIVEDGDIMTQVDSLFENESSFVRVSYRIYKNQPTIDVHIDSFWNEQDKALKVKIPCNFDGKFIAQIAYSQDEYTTDDTDKPIHRYVAMINGDNALAVYNKNVYDASCDKNDIYLMLYNGASYCTHIIENRPLIKDYKRFEPHIEQGKHQFDLRLSYDNKSVLENKSQEFTVKPYCLNVFPHGDGNMVKESVIIDNEAVALTAFYFDEDKYILRVINNNETENIAEIKIFGITAKAEFKKFEVKTFVYDGKDISERYNFI